MRKLIIDTDAGVDDSQAILMALAHPTTTISAITMVTGNVHVRAVAQNVPRILDVYDADIPFYIGADTPLVAPYVDAAHVHGDDGFGGADIPLSNRQPEDEHAVHALIRLINESPNEYDLLMLGPLTNLALAVRLDPTLPDKLKRLVIMGGTIGAHGNATPLAEYNFYADPEAVQIVLDTFGKSKRYPELISWETTLAHCMDWAWYTSWCNAGTERSTLVRKISERFTHELKSRGITKYALPDPLAMAVMLEPDLVEQCNDYFTAMELGGTYARGQLMVDYRGMIDGVTTDGYTPNMTVIEKINIEGFQKLLDNAVR
jgi:purine nucleosidase